MTNRKPLALTHILYEKDDPYGAILAFSSLLPILISFSLTTHLFVGKDLRAGFIATGALLTQIISTVLKKIIKEPRPQNDLIVPGTQKYGMPSSHSCFMAFIAVFSLLFAIRRCQNLIGPNAFVIRMKRWLMPAVTTLSAIVCSYSRIHLEYHTIRQVVAGSVLGLFIAIVWFILYEKYYVTSWASKLEKTYNAWDFRSPHDLGDSSYTFKKSLDARRKIFEQRNNGWKKES